MKTKQMIMRIIFSMLFFIMGLGNVFGQTALPNFVDYDQVGQSWSNYPLGSNSVGNGYTIKSHGCFMVSAAMLLKYSGLNVTPVEVNNWLATTNSNNFSQEKVTQYPGCTFTTNGNSTVFNASTLKWNIDNGNPIIVNVTNHFMVIKGYINGGTQMSDFIVSNPALSYDTYLNYYNGNTTQPVGTYTTIIRYLFYKNFKSYKLLSSNISLYGGSVSAPQPFYININENDFGWNFNKNQINNFRIQGVNTAISTSRITDEGQKLIDGIYWRKLKVQLLSNDVSGLSNGYNFRTISFDLTSGSQTITFKNDNLYFSSFSNNTFTDINDLNNWAKTYILKGANMGLFRGTSTTTYNPSGKLERQHAAKMIVEAGVRLGLLNINTSTSINGSFSDVSQSSEFFKHIQTLRNYGYINATTNFSSTNAISVGQICKLLHNVFKLTSSDLSTVNYQNNLLRKIVPVSNDSSIIPYMSDILRLVDIREATPNFYYGENIWDFKDFTNTNAITGTGYQVNGDETINRSIMAKLITNIVMWKAYKLNIPYFKAANITTSFNIDDFISIGEKYDNQAIPATSTLTLPESENYSVASGGNVVIKYPSNYDGNGNLQHFYWSMKKDGATLTSNSSSHNSVTFTAPNVSQPTQWKLYTYTANNKGKAKETYITINVGSSGGGSSSSVQAHSLNVYNITQNSVNLNWTRGNGAGCIVTCTDISAGNAVQPSSGTNYTANSNFGSAVAINSQNPQTKVVFKGTGSSVQVTGLSPNKQYRFHVYEFTGTTSNTQYNYNSVPVANATTNSIPANQPPAASLQWSYMTDFIAGNSYSFTNTSVNANSFLWTINNGAVIANPTSATTSNITFNNVGDHILKIKATNTATGAYSEKTYNLYVFSPYTADPDFEPVNLEVPANFTSGNPLNISVQVKNNSAMSPVYNTNFTFVLSTDTIFDENDHFLGTKDFTINGNQTVSINHTANNIYNSMSGTYYLIAKADYKSNYPAGYIDESNESNNIVYKQINLIQEAPDFVCHSVNAPSTLTPDTAFTISGTFQNLTNGQSYNQQNVLVNAYLSKDNILSSDDYSVNGSFNVNIGSGMSGIVNGSNSNFKIPSSVPSGNYYLFLAVDYCPYGSTGSCSWDTYEANEQNNYKSIPVQVVHTYEPTISASNYTISNVTNNGLRLSWTRGSGQACIVIGSQRSFYGEDVITKDNISYTASNNFDQAPNAVGFQINSTSSSATTLSNSKILYNGTGNYVDVVGLQPNKTYTFTVVEYNVNGSYYDYKQYNENILSIQAHTTSDGAVPFRKLIGIETTSGNDSPIVHFSDNANGFYYSPTRGFNITNDGGISWKRNVGLPTGAFSNTIFYDANNSKGYIGDWKGNLFKFSGSYNFEKIGTGLGVITGVYMNNNNGYLSSRGGEGASFYSNTGSFYKTINGGVTWNKLQDFARSITAMYFSDNNIGWISLGDIYTDYPSIKILKTTNGGNSWQTTYTVPIQNKGSFISDMKFFDNNKGIAVTSKGWVLKTENGGATWSEHNIFGNVVNESYDKWPKIKFYNNSVGYINFRNQKLAKTIDGGENWQIIDVQNIEKWHGDVYLLSENEIFLSGEGGILKSNTAGNVNGISVENINTAYCQGTNINLSYNTQGIYENNNVFSVQLSDHQGNFATSNELYTFTNSGSGTINIGIPTSIAVGNYKLRIVSSNPVIISNETNYFTLSNSVLASVSVTSSPAFICPGASVTFTAVPTNGGTNPSYVWKRNGQIVGANSNQLTISAASNDDVFWVEIVSNEPCANGVPVISLPISVDVTQIAPPFIQAIDNTLAASADAGVQWFFNNQPISGANSQFYDATQTGTYQFSVTVNGCTVMSDIYNLIYLGTENVNITKAEILVFPNPFSDELRMVSDNKPIKEVILFDMSGKQIKRYENLNTKEYKLNASHLPSGNYLVSVRTEDGVETYKVVKK